MLTDDELETRLRSSFDQATHDLHYTRRVTPPRPRAALVLAPALAVVGVGSAVAVGALAAGQPTARPAAPTHSAAPTVAATPSPTSRPECRRCHPARIEFAGYVMTYRRASGVPEDLARLVADPVAPPAGAQQVTNPAGVTASVALYPGTTMHALWVTRPTSNGGRPLALVANRLTDDQLAQLWRSGVPVPQ